MGEEGVKDGARGKNRGGKRGEAWVTVVMVNEETDCLMGIVFI